MLCWSGPITKTAVNDAREGLTAMLAGMPIRVPVRKPYGCCVKYKD